MAYGVLEKISNFLMPLEDEAGATAPAPVKKEKEAPAVRKMALQLHTQPSLQIEVAFPTKEEEAMHLADCMKQQQAVLVNYHLLDITAEKTMHAFLTGVSYVMNGEYNRVTERIYLFLPEKAKAEVKRYQNSVPTYRKMKL